MNTLFFTYDCPRRRATKIDFKVLLILAFLRVVTLNRKNVSEIVFCCNLTFINKGIDLINSPLSMTVTKLITYSILSEE